MSILETSQDGTFVFVALEDDATGENLMFKITRPTSTTPTTVTVYEPAGWSTMNVADTGDPDRMMFHGWLGAVDHAIAAGTNTEIDAADEEYLFLFVDPSDINHIIVYDNDNQEIIETDNLGANWNTLNDSLILSPVDAMVVIFFGVYFPFGGFAAGDDSVDQNLLYTPNEFSDVREDTSAALKAVTAMVSIDIAPG